MILLGIDTATESTSIGLCSYDKPPFVYTLSGLRNQLEVIGVGVQKLLSDSGYSIDEINGITLDVGPGLFTGLRVGISFAKSLAGALGVPIVPISSLDILAFAERHSPKLIVSLVDAKRGEVFYSMYKRVPGGGVVRQSSYCVATPQYLATEIATLAEPTLLVGRGASKYKEIFSKLEQVYFAGSSLDYPLMPMLFELAFPLMYSECFVSPESVEVIYIRDADAKINFEVRHALRNDS